MDEWMEVWVNGSTVGWVDERTFECMDGLMDACSCGWKEGWVVA